MPGKHNAGGCGCCGSGTGDDCDLCAPGTVPAEITVTFSGITYYWTCDCTDMNASWVLQQNTGAAACEWTATFPNESALCEDFENVTITAFLAQVPGALFLYVDMTLDTAPPVWARWRLQMPSPNVADCQTEIEGDAAFFLDNGIYLRNLCYLSDSAVAVEVTG